MLNISQLGFNTFWWTDLYTETALRGCISCVADLGYKYIEFKRDSFQPEHRAAQIAKAVALASESGLKTSNLVALTNLSNGEQQPVNDVIDMVRIASEVQVPLLNVPLYGGVGQYPQNPDHWWMAPQPCHATGWDHIVAALEKICAAADRYGVDIVAETLAGGFVGDFYGLQELFSRFDHPRLNLTMDPSHLFLWRNDIPYAIRRLGSKIKHVHLKDAVGSPGNNADSMFPLPGAGGIDWTNFFKALDDINYQGALSVEYEQFRYMNDVLHNDPAPAAAEGFRAASAVLQHYLNNR
jgi:sugar phosphate isomerase/epimerase